MMSLSTPLCCGDGIERIILLGKIHILESPGVPKKVIVIRIFCCTMILYNRAQVKAVF